MMTWILRATLAFAAAILPVAAQAQGTAQFKGIALVSRELVTRIAPPDKPFELDWYLPARELDDLLGTWSNFASEHTFHNGAPNALNMVVWHVTLNNFARTLGTWCLAPPLQLHERFAQTMYALCAWPAPQAKQETIMLAFWSGLMGYAAPRQEYIAWRDFFIQSSYRDKPASETVSAMALAIMMNPHFLLHR